MQQHADSKMCHTPPPANRLGTQHMLDINTVHNETTIKFKLDISINKESTLIIDTGSEISLLKANALNPKTKCFPQHKVGVMGISNSSKIQTIGLTQAEMTAGEVQIKHKFQVVSSEINFDTDGILGIDFLQKYNAIIDLSAQKLILCINATESPVSTLASKTETDGDHPRRSHEEKTVTAIPFASDTNAREQTKGDPKKTVSENKGTKEATNKVDLTKIHDKIFPRPLFPE